MTTTGIKQYDICCTGSSFRHGIPRRSGDGTPWCRRLPQGLAHPCVNRQERSQGQMRSQGQGYTNAQDLGEIRVKLVQLSDPVTVTKWSFNTFPYRIVLLWNNKFYYSEMNTYYWFHRFFFFCTRFSVFLGSCVTLDSFSFRKSGWIRGIVRRVC